MNSWLQVVKTVHFRGASLHSQWLKALEEVTTSAAVFSFYEYSIQIAMYTMCCFSSSVWNNLLMQTLDFSWSIWNPNLVMLWVVIFFFNATPTQNPLEQLEYWSAVENSQWAIKGGCGPQEQITVRKVGAGAAGILECVLLSCRRGIIVLSCCQGSG